MLRASRGGNIESLILLFSANTARWALVLKSASVFANVQFFELMVNSRYLVYLTFSICFALITMLAFA